MTIQDSLDKLITGNKRFVSSILDGNFQSNTIANLLTEGKEPFAVILSCSDSRVVPEFVFDAGLGELFVIRIAGNIANKSTIASIEYGVSQLGVKLIIVMGHQGCLAVTTAVQGDDFGKNLNHLLAHISPAISASKKNASINEIIQKNAKLTATELTNKSKILKEAYNSGSIQIIPAYYNLDTGKVDFFN